MPNYAWKKLNLRVTDLMLDGATTDDTEERAGAALGYLKDLCHPLDVVVQVLSLPHGFGVSFTNLNSLQEVYLSWDERGDNIRVTLKSGAMISGPISPVENVNKMLY